MKLFAVFNSLPDIMFLWYDKGYLRHLKSSLSRDEFWKTFDLDDESIRLNVIGQLFSPLIASQKYMLDIGKPYSSLTCEDGSVIVVHQYDDLFYVSLCGDGEESEWYLQRRLSFFNYLVNAKFGPSTDRLKPTSTLQRQNLWEYLKSILETWHTLCQQEQMFLVESLEILSVNAELSSKCLHLLEEALSKASKEGNAVHSLLLVNNKVLGLYSQTNAQELKTSDILLLTVFVKEKFRYVDKLVPSSLNRAPTQLVGRSMEKRTASFARQEGSEPKDIESRTPPNGPKKLSASPSSVADYMSANSTPNVEPSFHSSENFHTPHGGSPVSLSSNEECCDKCNNDSSNIKVEISNEDDDLSKPRKNDASPTYSEESIGAVSEDSNSKESQSSIGLSPREDTGKHHQIQLFLKTRDCPYTPHTIDMIKLDSATVLLTISENKMSKYAIWMYDILRNLRILLRNKSSVLVLSEMNFAAKLYEKLENGIKKLIDTIYANSELQYEILQNNLAVLKERWETAKQNGLKAYIESEEEEIPSNLYTPIIEVIKGIKAVFGFLFIQLTQAKQGPFERHMRIMSSIHELAINKLSDCSSYLQVRGQRNVTMTAYHNDFPGLVHFIYINRSTNQLIAPSMNQQSASTNNSQYIIKQHVWEMWQYSENHVTKGYLSYIIKDGEFIYSYFIWFEDAMGKPLSVQKTPKPNYNSNLTGVMTSDYYIDLIRYCFPTMSPDSVHCYELFCVHIGIVNNKFVTMSCKKLAAHLWETSGEASSPIGLL